MKIASSPMSRPGFTLIEILVVIAIIGVLLALLLPATQMARESARRIECVSNMKQILIAMNNYADVNGVLPMGYCNQYCEFVPDAMCISHGPFVAMLPHLEQQPLFNSVNFSRSIYICANTTIFSVGLKTLWCPSDPSITKTEIADLADTLADPIRLSSYVCNTGTWYNHGRNPVRTAQNNGLFWGASSVRPAEVTDGTSNTIAMGERAHGLLTPDTSWNWSWWADGDIGDTLYSALYPLNPQRRAKDGSLPFTDSLYWSSSASSFHPGGANFAMLDGSVRFIKDSINSWTIDPSTNLPAGLTQAGDPVLYFWGPDLDFGVYQRLHTRNFNDVVSGDSY